MGKLITFIRYGNNDGKITRVKRQVFEMTSAIVFANSLDIVSVTVSVLTTLLCVLFRGTINEV
jgi:hypothetical protein